MNEEDPEFEKTLRAINHYYITQVGICTAALSKLRSAELSDKNIIIRAIMHRIFSPPDSTLTCL